MTDDRPELDELATRLQRDRPELSPEAYDRVHDRVVRRVPARRRTSRASVATALVISLGVLLTGGGASLAVSGLASDTTAVRAQYQPTTNGDPPVPVAPTPTNPNPGVGAQGDVDSTPTTTTDDGQGAQGEHDASPSLGGEAGENDDQAAQAPQQVQVVSGGDELPFTGFAAIPVVIVGALLIAAGALLRRRTQS